MAASSRLRPTTTPADPWLTETSHFPNRCLRTRRGSGGYLQNLEKEAVMHNTAVTVIGDEGLDVPGNVASTSLLDQNRRSPGG